MARISRIGVTCRDPFSLNKHYSVVLEKHDLRDLLLDQPASVRGIHLDLARALSRLVLERFTCKSILGPIRVNTNARLKKIALRLQRGMKLQSVHLNSLLVRFMPLPDTPGH